MPHDPVGFATPDTVRDADATRAAVQQFPDWQLARRQRCLGDGDPAPPVIPAGVPDTLCARIMAVLDANESRLAIRDARTALTFGEIREAAIPLAARLHERLPPGAMVGLYFDASVEACIGLAAATISALPFVFLDASLPDERIRFMLDDAGIDVVVTTRALALRAMTAAVSAQLVTIEEAAAAGDGFGGATRRDGDIACLMYTSGSSGRPKAAVHTEGNLRAALVASADAVGLDNRDVVASTGFGTAASVTRMLHALTTGSSLLLHNLRENDVAALIARLRREKATILALPSPLMHVFLDALPRAGALPRIRLCRSHADTCRPEDVARFYERFGEHCTLLNGLASTEALNVSLYFTAPGESYDDGRVPVGFPLHDTHIDIVDDEGRAVVNGETGRLVITGRFVAARYWRDDASADGALRALPGDPARHVLTTGDRGRLAADGSLVHQGRVHSFLKISGYRVEIGEVAHQLRRLPWIRDAHVMPAKDRLGGDAIHAYVVASDGEGRDAQAVREALSSRLPAYMVPAAIAFVDAIPVRNNGKVDADALPSLSKVEAKPPRGAAPATPRERLLADIWSTLLGVDDVGREDDFFELGGTSLLAIEAIEAFRAQSGVAIPVEAFFARRTLSAICAAVARPGSPEHFRWLIPVRITGARPPLVCVHGDLLDVLDGLPQDQPFYVLWPIGMRGERAPDTLSGQVALYLDELGALPGDGPFVLAGFSIGGLIAWEMTRQLERLGTPPRRLILIDSMPPVPGVRRDDPERTARRRNCLDHVERGELVPEPMRTFYFLDCAARAAMSHHLESVDTPVVFLRSAVRRDRDTGYWQTRSPGGFSRHLIEGDHHSMLRHPNAGAVSDLVNAIVDDVMAEVGPDARSVGRYCPDDP